MRFRTSASFNTGAIYPPCDRVRRRWPAPAPLPGTNRAWLSGGKGELASAGVRAVLHGPLRAGNTPPPVPSLRHSEAPVCGLHKHPRHNKGIMSAPEEKGTVAGMLWETAKRQGRRPAIIDGTGTTDYGSLRDRAAAIATSLSRLGVRPNDRVGIFLDAGPDAVAAFFGVMAIGGIAIVINESLRPRQIEYMLEHASAVALITSTNLLDRQPRTLETACAILDVRDIPPAPTFEPVARHDTDPAQLTYPSGSTRLPKGGTISHGNLWAAMRAVTSYLGIVQEDRVASVLPFSFVYGMSQVLCAVGTGATLVIERSPLMQQLALNLRAREVTVLAAVPPLWLQLLRAPAFSRPIPALRIMTNARGHLPV